MHTRPDALTACLPAWPCLCPPSCRQAVKRAQQHMGSSQSEGLGGEEGEDAELGVRIHATYPQSLEREGFVGSSTSYNLPSSPEFELKTVGSSSGGSNGAAAGAPAAAAVGAVVAREKARQLGGSLQAALGPGGGAAGVIRHNSGKQKTSPQASIELDEAQRPRFSDGSAEAGDGAGREYRPTRRHSSLSGENLL